MFLRYLIYRLLHLLNLFRIIFSTGDSGMSLTNKLDDNYCEYDSTWEDDESIKVRREKKTTGKCRRNIYAARDMQEFRRSCENLDGPDEPKKKHFPNLDFYSGSASSKPDGVYIDEFHKEWQGDYERLEEVHSYIQWLFPIQEQGMNWQAHVLSKQEIKFFRKNETAKQNLVISYELMLDFYGIRLVDKKTGDVERATHWKERFDNLNRYTHNNLRITRILKCLGTLGFEHYQEKLVKFFLHETLVNKMLPNVKKSVLDYFMFAVLDKKQRQDLVKYAFKHFQPKEDFVWGPTNILEAAVKEHEMTNETKTPVKNKCEAFEENKTQEEESSEMQEDEMMPSSPTCKTAEDPRRSRISQEPVCIPKLIVLDPEENKSTAFEENTSLDREPIRKQETGEMSISNTTEDVRVVSEQKTQSGQSDFTEPQNDQDMINLSTEREDVNVKQSDVKDQLLGNPIPDLDGEQTSYVSDEISHNRKESSNSAQGEEKNGYVDHCTA
ncbi:opioid growth factor receptor-like protein 1 [Triplophysa dalaica]|uniref:opioid growth factor receptor-like protein 1 n=1 Tax=Triplophysa dalaica TaxID=1582913 RepID=UPI0024DF741D|nr:opioid growth factor receptor-like protein 1 [Triplophysa dalaica]